MSTSVGWSRALTAALVASFLLLVMGELGARWLHDQAQPTEEDAPPVGALRADPAAGYSFTPGYQEPEAGITINALGFRDRPRQAGPMTGPGIRVAVLGDDNTAGLGVEDHQHFSFLIEEAAVRLRSKDPQRSKLEFWNLGVPGFGIEQSMLQLLARWDEIQADFVVLNSSVSDDCWDDLVGPSKLLVVDGNARQRSWAPWPASSHSAARAELNRPLLAHGLPLDGALQRHSYAYRLLLNQLSKWREDNHIHKAKAARWPYAMEPFDRELFGGIAWLHLDPEPPPVRGCWKLTESILREFRDRLTNGLGVPLLLASLPSRIRVEQGDLQLALNEGWELGPRPGGGSRDGQRQLIAEQPERRLSALAKKLEIPILELQPALTRVSHLGPLYPPDEARLGPLGHQVLATEIAAFLETRAGLKTGLTEELANQLSRPGAPPSEGRTDVIPRLIEPKALLPLLPTAPPNWKVLAPPQASITSFTHGQGTRSFQIAQAEVTFLDPAGMSHTVRALDHGGQPEVEYWLREEAGQTVYAQVNEPLSIHAARLSLSLRSQSTALMERLETALLARLEQSLRASSDGRPPVSPILLAGGTDTAQLDDTRDRFAQRAQQLLAELPAPPAGWELIEKMPIVMPHELSPDKPLPAETEQLIKQRQWPAPASDLAVSAQARAWYRGPYGWFTLTLQDSGPSVPLLRAQLHDLAMASAASKSRENSDPSRKTLEINAEGPQPWSDQERTGFSTCNVQKGSCEVVVLINELHNQNPTLTGHRATLRAALDAPRQGFAELAAQLPRSLPQTSP